MLQGGKAAILDLNVEQGEAARTRIGVDSCKFFECDVGDSKAIETATSGVIAWIHETKYELGGIIPAAGIGLPTFSIDSDGKSCDMAMFDKVLRVNLRGSVELVTRFLPYWTKTPLETNEMGQDCDRGAIVFVSSIVAFEGSVGMAAYSASKAAISAVVVPFTRELAKFNIRVVAIAPGVFESPMSRALPEEIQSLNGRGLQFPRRWGQPSEFAAFALHILENVYVNGTTFRLDGGESCIRSCCLRYGYLRFINRDENASAICSIGTTLFC